MHGTVSKTRWQNPTSFPSTHHNVALNIHPKHGLTAFPSSYSASTSLDLPVIISTSSMMTSHGLRYIGSRLDCCNSSVVLKVY